jgi:hypothetical protein
MLIGFTGTSKGMTHYQKQRVSDLLKELKPHLVRHDDRVGSNTEFHQIASSLNIKTCIHPPDSDSKRAFNQSDSILPVKPYLDRNKDVDMSYMLIATPEPPKEGFPKGKISVGLKGRVTAVYLDRYTFRPTTHQRIVER